MRVLSLELTDPHFYHLDTCFCPLDAETAAYYPPAFDPYARRVLAANTPRLIEVEAHARERGWRTRRTGTSVAVLHANGASDLDGSRRVTNLEDVFVLLTGEEIE